MPIKKIILPILIIIIILCLVFIFKNKHTPADLNPLKIAEQWMQKNAQTYVFDGMDLSLKETLYPDIAGCENCHQFVFSFNSRHAGYGNREGEMLAQVITPHETIITIENKKVINALTDNVFDEISKKTIADDSKKPSLFEEKGTIVINNPGLKPNVWYLVYEKVGESALNISLEFIKESKCFKDNIELNACDSNTLKSGTRVLINGTKTKDAVIVKSLIILE